jgi:hypothetical protein
MEKWYKRSRITLEENKEKHDSNVQYEADRIGTKKS